MLMRIDHAGAASAATGRPAPPTSHLAQDQSLGSILFFL